ncbi:MAG TPA: hypothetical protein VL125_08830 [Pelobium sp.]|jgi:hypothetical protein|nr:hypothetical protein [Pelobium sp.]
MTHKLLYFWIFCSVLFSCNTSSKKEIQTEKVSKITETKSSVNKIETLAQIPVAYQTIDSLVRQKSVDSSSFSYNCAGEKSGKVTYYRKNNELILVEKIYAEYSHTEGKDQYFIKDGQPFFVFRKITVWAFDGNAKVEGATIDKVTEKRFYLVNGKLEKCLQKQYEISSTTKEDVDPTRIENKKSDCPSVENLLTDYNVLLSHKNQHTNIECL